MQKPNYLSLLRFTVQKMARAQRPDLGEREVAALAEMAMVAVMKSDHAAQWDGPEALATLEASNECLPDGGDVTLDWRQEYQRWTQQPHRPMFFLTTRGGVGVGPPDTAVTNALDLLSDLDRRQWGPDS